MPVRVSTVNRELRPLGFFNWLRYGTVTICYLILLLSCAFIALAIALVLVLADPPQLLSSHLLEPDRVKLALGVLVGTGGIGGLLAYADIRERDRADSRELLNQLRPGAQRDKVLEDVIRKLFSAPKT